MHEHVPIIIKRPALRKEPEKVLNFGMNGWILQGVY